VSNTSETTRVISAAQTPGWSIGVGRTGAIMATYDSGDVGLPWVVVAEKNGGRMKVSRYEPGDDVEREGEVVGELTGTAREMGRQLREVLADTEGLTTP
jgi:hypothetical protein